MANLKQAPNDKHQIASNKRQTNNKSQTANLKRFGRGLLDIAALLGFGSDGVKYLQQLRRFGCQQVSFLGKFCAVANVQ